MNYFLSAKHHDRYMYVHEFSFLVDIREIARHLYDIWLTKGVFKTIDIHTPQRDIDERSSSRMCFFSSVSFSLYIYIF